MARARNIKPGFFKNELLVELDPFDRLLFIGLWCLADREGRIEDRPKRIKMELFPCDSYHVDSGLNELLRCKFITRYESLGIAVIELVNFSKHQSPHGSEKDSLLPSHDGLITTHDRNASGHVTGLKRTNSAKFESNSIPCTGIAPVKTDAAPVQLPVETDASTGLAPCKTALNPESRILIPDLLNPDLLNPDLNTVSDKSLFSPEKPKTAIKPKKEALKEMDCPLNVDHQTWKDFLALRKAKKAPVTQTTMKGAALEAEKAGMTLEAFLQVWCRRGSQGLEASWLNDTPQRAKTSQAESFKEKDARLGRERWEEMTGRIHPDNMQPSNLSTIDSDIDLLELGNE